MKKKPFPETIRGERVILKKHRLDIAKIIFSYVDKDRKRLRRFLPWVDSTKSVQDTKNFIKKTHRGRKDGTLFDYGIFDRKSGVYMGNIGLHSIKWQHECCEIGYWILGDFEGKGFMSEAVSALETICFKKMFHRVEIRCSSFNKRSAAVPKRLGYRLDGVLRHDVIEMGRYRNTLIFGKINPKPSPFANRAK